MGSILNPYVSFSGNAREAMEFYQSVFGGKLEINTYGESAMPDAPADQIMHALLATDAGYTIMASDTPPGMPYNPGQNISISLSGEDVDRLRGYFGGLSAGGNVVMPLEKQMWGDEFGMLTDRFGIAWMVNISGT
ncbi:VOC family protein [Glycomyces buryatensis]|uniref:VOC family protein n=1 Tax=Glycomyces buryatensis TaxID=2570927 RepID=A0A4S8PU99_9ACTN|nr:VOC family protein [Glycomyces buryatensis]THV33445.1 VOC family protein [Glycomyces buryatensis]